MTEPSVEEIVAKMEFMLTNGQFYADPGPLRALIASWRKRGEALAVARAVVAAIREYHELTWGGRDEKRAED